MKRFAIILLALLSLQGCTSDRDHILKVYNWADYIDEDLIGEFEQWYEQQTGESVKIVYQTFDINESMLSKIEKGHEDYDVVCPSDYIIERMLRSDLLIPIDRDFGQTPDYTANVAPFIKNMMDNVNGSGKNANEYSVGYMWGTCGLIYNPKYLSKERVQTWDIIQDPELENKLFMKDAFRDIYTTLLIALNHDKIESGERTVEEISLDTSDESIAMVEQYLMKCKNNIAGWEADFGKEYMTQEKGWLNFSWSGDAEWAIQEAKETGVVLDYAVPAEGSCVWFDGWVIPKYARNVKAARYFINFLCLPENALRNMDAIGYVSAIGGPEILQAKIDSTEFEAEDASYFFGEDGVGACLNPVQYPDASIISRCGMMHDTGDRTEALQEMWSRVKGDNAGTSTYIVIICAAVAVIGAALATRARKKSRHGRRR